MTLPGTSEPESDDGFCIEPCDRCGDPAACRAVRVASGISSAVAEPWGHKLTISVYVAGTIEQALAVADQLADVEPVQRIDFMGTAVEVVRDQPRDQGGT